MILESTLERYRSEITRRLWEEAKPTVRISPDVAAVIGDRAPDEFWEDEMPVYYGPSWLEDRSWAWLLFYFEQYEEMRRMKRRRYFHWNTEPKVGCSVWVDEGQQGVRMLSPQMVRSGAKANWKPETSPDVLDPEPTVTPRLERWAF